MNTLNHDNPKENNPVHTPTPPQVMDPSQFPKRQDLKEGNKKGKKKPSDKNKEGNEKLTPKEGL